MDSPDLNPKGKKAFLNDIGDNFPRFGHWWY